MSVTKTLTEKQHRFIDEFLIDQNAAAAYRRAGYKAGSDGAVKASASRLLANANIRAEIDARLLVLAKVARITADEAWSELGCIARSDIGDIIDMTGTNPRLKPANQIPERARRAIKSVKVKRYVEPGDSGKTVEIVEFTLWDKPGQINIALKALGELKDTLELTGKGGVPLAPAVNIYLPSNGRDHVTDDGAQTGSAEAAPGAGS